MKWYFAGAAAIIWGALCLPPASVMAATLPTTGLLTQLQAVPEADVASNLSNYGVFSGTGGLADPYKMMVWYDQIVDNTDGTTLTATSQDYGQDIAGRRPSLTSTVMPNNQIFWVPDFEGGVGGNAAAELARDYLQNKPGGVTRVSTATPGTEVSGNTIAAGGFAQGVSINSSLLYNPASTAANSGDAAYNANNSAISWAVVFRTDDIALNDQYVYIGGHTDASTKYRAAFLQDTTSPVDLDADTTVEIKPYTRPGAAGGVNFQQNYGNAESKWYIATGTWKNIDDVNNATFSTILRDQDGNELSITDTGASVFDEDGLTAMIRNRMGFTASSSTTSDASAFFNGQIAELVIWNAGLSATDLTNVTDYLDGKYFTIVPEPSAFMILGLGMLGLGAARRRSRKSSSSES